MLKSLVKGAANRLFTRSLNKKKMLDLAIRIESAGEDREWQVAIDLLRELLTIEPKNISALLRLGRYLLEIGEKQEAFQSFELANRLDDSNMEVVVNYAQCLAEGGHIEEAMASLARAQLVIPDYPYINSILSTIQFRIGKTKEAQKFSLRAWLAYFDNSRVPDSYLWHSAYVDQPEGLLASEHHFWAGTCNPLSEKIAKSLPVFGKRDSSKKMRVGYWSPDFRDHSVRYFFRPLLEGHNKDVVEIYIYHDASSSDRQTDEVEAHADHFHSVHQRTDEELVKLIASHDLDVLVELAGHTSHNRLWLMQGRLARVQLTGLGYPPTTGLSTIDAKFVDPHIQNIKSWQFYTEQQLILPTSFWCFDPRDDAPLPEPPPVLKMGHITFGCFGNVAKINEKILLTWSEILKRVPKSRLLLRAVNFNSKEAVLSFEEKLQSAGISNERFSLLGPVSSAEFFTSYNELDIVLDTHPFNGGTTTCFAIYMGVPVVTLAGDSLISRMGKSVVTNVGAPELAVDNLKQYVSKAVSLSQDIKFLKTFRSAARSRFKQSSLGDGGKFAHDVETAYEKLVKQGIDKTTSEVSPLPPQELIRRAGAVVGFGNPSASDRIIKYCLLHYPNYAPAYILLTEEMTKIGQYGEAAAYLIERLPDFDADEHAVVLINVIRFKILAADLDGAASCLMLLRASNIQGLQDRLQLMLFNAVLSPTDQVIEVLSPAMTHLRAITCVIPCDDFELYTRIVVALSHARENAVSDVTFLRCREVDKISEYHRILHDEKSDVIIFIQKNISIQNPHVFKEIIDSLDLCDVVGFSGARRWARFDWRLDEFNQRAGAYSVPLAEKQGLSELCIAGPGASYYEPGMAVLEGGLLAVNAKKVAGVLFDEDLVNAGFLLEEKWSYDAGRAGARLAVNRKLGVHVNSEIMPSTAYLLSARSAVVKKMAFDVFLLEGNDASLITCPVSSPDAGFAGINRYLSPAD